MRVTFAPRIVEEAIPVRSLAAGDAFLRNNTEGLCIRLKPTSYILNSSLVVDSIDRGQVLIANVIKGTCYFIPGEELIWPKVATIRVEEN
jgi:hypothetical protein